MFGMFGNKAIQCRIDRIIELQEYRNNMSFEELSRWDRKDLEDFQFELYDLIFDVIDRFYRKEKLPLNLDETQLQILHDGVPIAFCYEQINDNLFALWDVCHSLNDMHEIHKIKGGRDYNLPKREKILIDGFKKVKPEIVALEANSGIHQNAINLYCFGLISRHQLNEKFRANFAENINFYHDVATLVDYCIEKEIAVVCIDWGYDEFKNCDKYYLELREITKKIKSIEDIINSNKDVDSEINANKAEIIKLKQNYFDTSCNLRDQRFFENLNRLTPTKTLFVVGARHRPNILSLFNKY